MFIHSERVELLCCFVLKLLENWKHFEMALNLFSGVWFSFVYVLLDSVSYGS